MLSGSVIELANISSTKLDTGKMSSILWFLSITMAIFKSGVAADEVPPPPSDNSTDISGSIEAYSTYMNSITKWFSALSDEKREVTLPWLDTPQMESFEAISAVAAFMKNDSPKPDSPEMKNIQVACAKLQAGLNLEDAKLDHVISEKLALIATKYKNVRTELKTLLKMLESMAKYSNEHTVDMFREQCIQKDPMHLLTWLHDQVVNESPPPALVASIFEAVHYNLTALQTWFIIVSVDLRVAAALQHTCVIITGGDKINASYVTSLANDTANTVRDAARKLNETERKLIDQFHIGAEQDIEEITQRIEAQNESAAEIHATRVSNLSAFLSKKYFWMHWAIRSYDKTYGSKNHFVDGLNDSYILVTSEQKIIFAGWCSKNGSAENFQLPLEAVKEFYETEEECAAFSENAEKVYKFFKKRHGAIRQATTLHFLREPVARAQAYTDNVCMAYFHKACKGMNVMAIFNN